LFALPSASHTPAHAPARALASPQSVTPDPPDPEQPRSLPLAPNFAKKLSLSLSLAPRLAEDDPEPHPPDHADGADPNNHASPAEHSPNNPSGFPELALPGPTPGPLEGPPLPPPSPLTRPHALPSPRVAFARSEDELDEAVEGWGPRVRPVGELDLADTNDSDHPPTADPCLTVALQIARSRATPTRPSVGSAWNAEAIAGALAYSAQSPLSPASPESGRRPQKAGRPRYDPPENRGRRHSRDHRTPPWSSGGDLEKQDDGHVPSARSSSPTLPTTDPPDPPDLHRLRKAEDMNFPNLPRAGAQGVQSLQVYRRLDSCTIGRTRAPRRNSHTYADDNESSRPQGVTRHRVSRAVRGCEIVLFN
jgi:hypothetical protein